MTPLDDVQQPLWSLEALQAELPDDVTTQILTHEAAQAEDIQNAQLDAAINRTLERQAHQIAELEDAVANYKQQVADLVMTVRHGQEREQLMAGLLAEHHRAQLVAAEIASEAARGRTDDSLANPLLRARLRHDSLRASGYEVYHTGLGGVGDCTMPRQSLLTAIRQVFARDNRDED